MDIIEKNKNDYGNTAGWTVRDMNTTPNLKDGGGDGGREQNKKKKFTKITHRMVYFQITSAHVRRA